MAFYTLRFTDTIESQLLQLKRDNSQQAQYKAVKKALNFLQQNPKHPSLHSHRYYSLKGPNSEPVWESYAQQNTPGAYRIFWFYGPKRMVITVFSIIPHP